MARRKQSHPHRAESSANPSDGALVSDTRFKESEQHSEDEKVEDQEIPGWRLVDFRPVELAARNREAQGTSWHAVAEICLPSGVCTPCDAPRLCNCADSLPPGIHACFQCTHLQASLRWQPDSEAPGGGSDACMDRETERRVEDGHVVEFAVREGCSWKDVSGDDCVVHCQLASRSDISRSGGAAGFMSLSYPLTVESLSRCGHQSQQQQQPPCKSMSSFPQSRGHPIGGSGGSWEPSCCTDAQAATEVITSCLLGSDDPPAPSATSALTAGSHAAPEPTPTPAILPADERAPAYAAAPVPAPACGSAALARPRSACSFVPLQRLGCPPAVARSLLLLLERGMVALTLLPCACACTGACVRASASEDSITTATATATVSAHAGTAVAPRALSPTARVAESQHDGKAAPSTAQAPTKGLLVA